MSLVYYFFGTQCRILVSRVLW